MQTCVQQLKNHIQEIMKNEYFEIRITKFFIIISVVEINAQQIATLDNYFGTECTVTPLNNETISLMWHLQPKIID